MLTKISNPRKPHLLTAAVLLMVLFILPANLVYAGWPELDKLLASDGAAGDRFGNSVSISGDYAIVGAYYDDDNGTNSGSAYIFFYDGTSWSEQAKLLASDGNTNDYFGYSVSISGDYAIVGAVYDDDNGTNSGSAYIFKRSGTSWSEQAKLTASDGAAGDEFGVSVSISGDYAIVGAYKEDYNGANSGSAYIFKRSGTNWSEQAKLTASDGFDYDEFGGSVSISGDYAIVGAWGDDDSGINSGSAYIFYYNGTNWSQQAKLTTSDGANYDWFGGSVSVSGDYAIVGAYGDDDSGLSSGSAYIFKRSGTSWSEQAKLLAADGAEDDQFGWSVSISGDYAIAGAFKDDDNGTNSGSAYIFFYDGTSWSEQAKLLASDGAAGDLFGYSASISGDYAIVGAAFDDDNGVDSGSAYIYISSEIHGTKWHDIDGDGRFVEDTDEQEQGLPGWRIYIDENENGQFDAGEANDITDADGNYVLIVPSGTWLVAEEDRSCWEQTYPGGDGTYSVTLETGEVAEGLNFGNARPTEIHPSVFQQEEQDKLTASDGANYDWFGGSVSVSGDYAIVGASRDDDDNGVDSGSAYIFERNQGGVDNWGQQAKLTASDGAAADWFGISVSISGDYAIVGAYKDDDNGADSGSAYIFKRSGTNWSEQAKLTASDGNDIDYFGNSVSISGDYAIVGAYLDDDYGVDSGSAYIFKRSGTSWSEQVKLLASDGADYDWFGYSVSISGDYAIVGAYADDDYGTNSGSAYIFERSGTTWSEQFKWLAADGAASDLFGYSVSISSDYAIAGAHFDDDSGGASGSAYMFGKGLCPISDLTGDCLVDFKDFAVFSSEWLVGVE